MGTGVFTGTLKHLPAVDQEQLTIEAISTEAVTTSEIEGEILDRSSVQSSIRRQFGLATDNRRVPAAEQAISEMMVDLYRSFAEPLAADMLFFWHRQLFRDRGGLRDIGRYRTDDDAMEVVSGPAYAPKVHFEAPPSSAVPREMARFVAWFNRTAPWGQRASSRVYARGHRSSLFRIHSPVRGWERSHRPCYCRESRSAGFGPADPSRLGDARSCAHQKRYYEALERANQAHRHNRMALLVRRNRARGPATHASRRLSFSSRKQSS